MKVYVLIDKLDNGEIHSVVGVFRSLEDADMVDSKYEPIGSYTVIIESILN